MGIARASSNDNSTIMTSPRRCNGLARSKIMLRRNMLFGDLFPTKSAICLFGVNSIECEIRHVHYLWECADNNPHHASSNGMPPQAGACWRGGEGEIFSASMSPSFGFG